MKKIFLLIIFPFILAGCFQVKTKPALDGGIYRSKDRGENFEQITKIATVGEPKNFSDANTIFLLFDPTDANTLYYSSQETGLVVSYNGGSSWRTLLKNKGTVLDFEVNPNSPCELFATTKQNLFKSNDCGRRWNATYLEKVARRSIRDLALDYQNPNRLFLYLSDGSIILSEDSGVSWKVWSRFQKPAKKVFVNPKNSQIMYLTTGSALYKSTDQGVNWENLTSIITKDFEFKEGQKVKELYFIPEYEDGFYTISPYGILKTPDGGETWKSLPLLPKPKKETILSLTANPANMNELYYSTVNAIYYSNDGGTNWKTLKSPTKRRNKTILMHPKDSKLIYIGAYAPPKK